MLPAEAKVQSRQPIVRLRQIGRVFSHALEQYVRAGVVVVGAFG
jgi:hypothetical protein